MILSQDEAVALAAGASTGIIADLSLFPLDFLKTHAQGNNVAGVTAAAAAQAAAAAAPAAAVSAAGAPAAVAGLPQTACAAARAEKGASLGARWESPPATSFTATVSGAAGMAAGAVAAVVTTPMDVVKTRLMTQTPGTRHMRCLWVALGGGIFLGGYDAFSGAALTAAAAAAAAITTAAAAAQTEQTD
ncbi:mitochondrial carrier domain-containing protein, putative [Eimeria brunetti]|uniref:Mitochondrial carrier domain-containing protein, putative n=1 Tax=Eimeria brunetti TaxID=51314 RepID=U6L9U3_9EIME|nr:mitochondrial carrier domain-containing protein, putative [Eimeria brunetti]